MEEFIDWVMETTPEWDATLALLYFVEGRPTDENGKPDHELGIGLYNAGKVGSLSYIGPGPSGKWYSKGDHVNPEGVTYAYYETPHEWPADSEVPMDIVKQATREFLESGGERPTAVQWQPDPGTLV